MWRDWTKPLKYTCSECSVLVLIIIKWKAVWILFALFIRNFVLFNRFFFIYSISMNDKHFLRFIFSWPLSSPRTMALNQNELLLFIFRRSISWPASYLWLSGFLFVLFLHIFRVISELLRCVCVCSHSFLSIATHKTSMILCHFQHEYTLKQLQSISDKCSTVRVCKCVLL